MQHNETQPGETAFVLVHNTTTYLCVNNMFSNLKWISSTGVDITIEAGRLRLDAVPDYRNKSILLVDVTHAGGPKSGGPHADMQRADRDGSAASTPLRRAQAQSLRPSGTGVLRRAQLQTRHPRGGKRWAPSTSAATSSPPSRWKTLGSLGARQRPDPSGGGQHCRGDGRIVPSAERGVRKERLFTRATVERWHFSS